MTHHALIIGGSNGIGLALAKCLLDKDYRITIADRCRPDSLADSQYEYRQVNLVNADFGFLSSVAPIDTLLITAGFGRVTPFEEITEAEIDNSLKVNTLTVLRTLHHFYSQLAGPNAFHCAVMGSIAGHISSPLMATYAASKAAVCRAIESLNIELEASGSANRILDVSPGSIKGTLFNGGHNDLSLTMPLAEQIVTAMLNRDTLLIPDYEHTFAGVLNRYHNDPHQFGLESYSYKTKCGRLSTKPQLIVGYLSGTFDLFHIGHLNILRRAKQMCDYLVVGVHKDGSHKGKEVFIPLEERMDILRNIRFVDQVIPSLPEDCDIYLNGIVKYNRLFVGSDYKGTPRFERYEQLLGPLGVEIVYFPYTQGTSSTQLRAYIAK